jgi:hypothetical protein
VKSNEARKLKLQTQKLVRDEILKGAPAPLTERKKSIKEIGLIPSKSVSYLKKDEGKRSMANDVE